MLPPNQGIEKCGRAHVLPTSVCNDSRGPAQTYIPLQPQAGIYRVGGLSLSVTRALYHMGVFLAIHFRLPLPSSKATVPRHAIFGRLFDTPPTWNQPSAGRLARLSLSTVGHGMLEFFQFQGREEGGAKGGERQFHRRGERRTSTYRHWSTKSLAWRVRESERASERWKEISQLN